MQRAKDATRGLRPAGPLEAADPGTSNRLEWRDPDTKLPLLPHIEDPIERQPERSALADLRWWRKLAPDPRRALGDPIGTDRGHRHRAKKAGAEVGHVDLLEIARRDGWRCGICHKRVGEFATGRRSASLDHIVPLSRGGAHVPENSQLCHLECNFSKNASDAIPSQLPFSL